MDPTRRIVYEQYKKTNSQNFPFHWIDLQSLSQSKANRVEIYLIEDKDLVSDLMSLFYTLFGPLKNDILIYNESWWDFCLDTWNSGEEKYDYKIKGKSKESQNYLKLLYDSQIELGYSGSCRFNNWDTCLPIILECIISHQAPYSPFFYSIKNEFLFYFHHSGSIGLLYNKKNEILDEIIRKAEDDYEIR